MLRTSTNGTQGGAVALALIAGVACTASASATVLLNQDFNSFDPGADSFVDTGLVDLTNNGNPTLNNVGFNGTVGLDTGNGGVVGTGDLINIPAIVEFSGFFGLGVTTSVNTGSTGGGFWFGWTKASTDFNPYDGNDGAGPAEVTDHVSVGLRQTGGDTPTYRLAWANGTSQAMQNNAGNEFGTDAVVLTQGNWYNLHGTIAYHAATSSFSFSVQLDDYGTGGETNVGTVLSGSVSNVVIAGFDEGTLAQVFFGNNQQRGTRKMDNLYAAIVPEPASLAFVGFGALMVTSRRCRT